MILVDFSQTFIAAVMAQCQNGKIAIDEGLIRHISLNMLRSYNSKFKKDYGELIVCCDHKHSWRKDIFPYYKKHRQKAHDKSKVDWNELYRYLDIIIPEIDENLPYRVIRVDGAEGDDILYVLATNASEGFLGKESILIISGDEDMIQFQSVGNVTQYFPLKKKIIINPNPSEFLFDHVICGDETDGVPSILDPDNAVYDKLPKKKMTKKRLLDLKEKILSNTLEGEVAKNYYNRNNRLINLAFVPEEIRKAILIEFEMQAGKDRKKLFNYLMKMKLKGLMQNMGDF